MTTEPTTQHEREREDKEGRPLQDFLRDPSQLPEHEWSFALFEEVCRSLQTFHDAETFHWQLSADTIMLRELPTLTQVIPYQDIHEDGTNDDLQVSPAKKPWEKSLYAAPEVRRGQEPSARSDVYSLAAIFYELLTGSPPGDDPELPDTDERFKEYEWDGMVIAIEQALDPNPEERYPSVEDFWDTIAESRRDPDAAPPSPIETYIEKARTFASKRVKKGLIKGGSKQASNASGGRMEHADDSASMMLTMFLVKELFGSALHSSTAVAQGAIEKKLAVAKAKRDKSKAHLFRASKKTIFMIGLSIGIATGGGRKIAALFRTPPPKSQQHAKNKRQKKKRIKPISMRIWQKWKGKTKPTNHRPAKRPPTKRP
jgi:serine/threonine protein kinase